MAELNGEQPAEVVITTEVDPAGTTIVTVSGELDISTTSSLEAAIASITSERPERLIFDLSGLRFMDSAGIAVLLGAAAKIRTVHLRNPSPAVRRILDITGLGNVLPIET
jgi:stage II sporulation protein AA (anti-sigma F factor antagonist)